MDRRGIFFLIAAVLCALVSPLIEESIRWIAYWLVGTYIVLAILSMLDFYSRRSDRIQRSRRPKSS